MQVLSLSGKNSSLSKEDYARFLRCTSTSLTPEQEKIVTKPAYKLKRQKSILAVHWHPEFVPMDLIKKRIEKTFPNAEESLIIPTQHNQIMEYGEYAGVEVDCYSTGFHRKVQLLIHFQKEKLSQASVFTNILKHTFSYRSSQLFDYLHALTKPNEKILNHAAHETGASQDLITFVQEHAQVIKTLLEDHIDELPAACIKNKLIRDYFDTLRDKEKQVVIDRAQTFLRAVKYLVKEEFPLDYFYRTSEVIEEARHLGAGIVIPHPEQFWPILLADYDIDGYEVWNPQSSEYTEFLITVMNRRNKQPGHDRDLLIFMGDDTHMSEKIKDPKAIKKDKACREIGVQPPWDDMQIRKQLWKAGMDRPDIIREYKARLHG